MPYVNVPNDLSKIKTKIAFNLTKRQLVCFGGAALVGILAYLFSRTKFARYRVFDILFMIPFMTPPYIASMGWILFMQKKGLL